MDFFYNLGNLLWANSCPIWNESRQIIDMKSSELHVREEVSIEKQITNVKEKGREMEGNDRKYNHRLGKIVMEYKHKTTRACCHFTPLRQIITRTSTDNNSLFNKLPSEMFHSTGSQYGGT